MIIGEIRKEKGRTQMKAGRESQPKLRCGAGEKETTSFQYPFRKAQDKNYPRIGVEVCKAMV